MDVVKKALLFLLLLAFMFIAYFAAQSWTSISLEEDLLPIDTASRLSSLRHDSMSQDSNLPIIPVSVSVTKPHKAGGIGGHKQSSYAAYHDEPLYASYEFNNLSVIINSANWTLVQSDLPFNAYVVRDSGNLLARISHYNEAISELRALLWERKQHSEWQQPRNISVVWGCSDDYFKQLSKFPDIVTVVLPWIGADDHNHRRTQWSSHADSQNVLVQDYFKWMGTEPLCTWIKSPAFTKARWDAVFNRTCEEEYEHALKPASIEPLYFHGKPINPNQYWPHEGKLYPSYFYSTLPPHILYAHIAHDAVIAETGDVFSGQVKVVPYTCSHDTNPSLPHASSQSPIYRDVFVITQFWCASFFHKMLECLPRIAPYLSFLKANKEVHIHVAENGGSTIELLEYLGIGRERLISGTARAKMVILPQGTPCGFPVPLESQLLSYHFRHLMKSPPHQRSLVLIKRSGTRHFSYHQGIERSLKQVASDFNLTFQLFADDPTPALPEAMKMFRGALAIVAPHGAGLSNMIFSQPGTLVIEGVCNPPHVNMCFQWTAHSLGHRYHAVPSRGGCEGIVEVFPETIDFIVRTHLQKIVPT